MKQAFSGGITPHYLGKLIGTANPTEASYKIPELSTITSFSSLKKEKTRKPCAFKYYKYLLGWICKVLKWVIPLGAVLGAGRNHISCLPSCPMAALPCSFQMEPPWGRVSVHSTEEHVHGALHVDVQGGALPPKPAAGFSVSSDCSEFMAKTVGLEGSDLPLWNILQKMWVRGTHTHQHPLPYHRKAA